MSIDILIKQAQSLPVSRREEWVMDQRTLDVSISELGEDRHPELLVCLSPKRGVIGFSVIAQDAPDEEALRWAVQCMTSPMVGDPGRPETITLAGGKLTRLKDFLEQLDIRVNVTSSPHPAIDRFTAKFYRDLGAPRLLPYSMEEGYQDTDIVAAFFQSAAEFYKQKPWKYFEVELPIKIELGVNDEQFTYWAIITGVGGESRGLFLYESYDDVAGLLDAENTEEALDVIQNIWSMTFAYMPVRDIGRLARDELNANGWTLANRSAYPAVVVTDPGATESRLPVYEEMVHLHVITIALATFFRDNKKEIKALLRDAGKILTFKAALIAPNGEIPVSIQIPAQEYVEELADILEGSFDEYDEEEDEDDEDDEDDLPVVMGGSSLPSSPLGRAYDYIYQATQADSKSRMVKLAKQALAISADCVDGYLIRAYRSARDDAEKLKFLKQAVEAGKRIISREDMKRFEGHYWQVMDTRPYLRAIDDLAEFQMELGNYVDAIENHRELIRLDPRDHQDIRYDLANCYLLTHRYDDLDELLKKYRKDMSAPMLFASALMSFGLHGDTKQANNELKRAIKENHYVADFLLGRKPLPKEEPIEYEFGDEDEAVFYARLAMNAWKQTQGAIEWLRKAVRKD